MPQPTPAILRPGDFVSARVGSNTRYCKVERVYQDGSIVVRCDGRLITIRREDIYA